MKDFTKEQKESLIWFKDKLPELLKKYKDKEIVIVNKEVIGVFDDFIEAYNFAIKKGHQEGDFIIQEVIVNDHTVNFINVESNKSYNT